MLFFFGINLPFYIKIFYSFYNKNTKIENSTDQIMSSDESFNIFTNKEKSAGNDKYTKETGRKKHMCFNCTKSFLYPNLLKNHIARMHSS